jgi:phosphoheptose isomerase
MRLPTRNIPTIAEYAQAYAAAIDAGWKSVNLAALERAAGILQAAYGAGKRVFACGNGGSAAISNHMACDHSKGIATDTRLSPGVISLSANVELITAIANDMSYEEIFVFQLSKLARPGDVLIAVSSSGNSPNILAALSWAKRNNVLSIGMSGFSGGRLREGADISLHVEIENYGVVEDLHQGLMHVLAQYIRQVNMDKDAVPSRAF